MQNYYQTSDLALASFLTLHYPIDSIEKSNSKKMFFYFKREEHLDDLLQLYFSKQTKVEPQDYFNAIREVKNRLYNQ